MKLQATMMMKKQRKHANSIVAIARTHVSQTSVRNLPWGNLVHALVQ